MTEKGFIPLTGELGIPGTSYRIQLGLINEKWASRLLKGKGVLDSYVYKDEDTSGGFPNQNLIVGWVLRTIAIPNINPHQVMKTTQALVKQALRRKEERKAMVPVSETKDVQLDKVPEDELKRQLEFEQKINAHETKVKLVGDELKIEISAEYEWKSI